MVVVGIMSVLLAAMSKAILRSSSAHVQSCDAGGSAQGRACWLAGSAVTWYTLSRGAGLMTS